MNLKAKYMKKQKYKEWDNNYKIVIIKINIKWKKIQLMVNTVIIWKK